MKDRWEALVAVLGKILSIYQAILTLSQEKKKILVAANAQELENVTKQEEILILQVGKLEEIRRKLVGELISAHGMTEEGQSLLQLQKIATPTVAQELENFRKKMGGIMEEIASLNKLNTELINQALGFINYNINILSQTVVGPTYAPKGQANEQTKRTVFDAKV